jgi:hypothetical protein
MPAENFCPETGDFEQSHRYFLADLAVGERGRSL